MGSIVVVIPSRGRPERAREAVRSIRSTAALVSTSVILAVDADDPALPEYEAITFPPFGPEWMLVTLRGDETGNLVRATNTVSMRVANADPTAIIGNFGDDHHARTPGWDRLITDALATPGIAYGDDGIHGAHLPTAPFISAEIVLALGWYALPTCRHLYIDDAWKLLGRQAGILRWVPEVSIEHMHPAVGKAEWDAGYEKANNHKSMKRDEASFHTWRRSKNFTADLRNIQRALEEKAA